MIEDPNNFGILTSDKEKQQRITLCASCPEKQIVANAETCMKCACPIDYVITYRFKLCPIGNWS